MLPNPYKIHTSAISDGGAQKLSGASARYSSRAKAPSMVLRGRSTGPVLELELTIRTASPVLSPLSSLFTACILFFLVMVL